MTSMLLTQVGRSHRVCEKLVAIFLMLAWLTGNVTSVQALSFDLQRLTYKEDGFTREQTYFPDGAVGNIYITFPPTWVVTAGGSTLKLTNPASPNSAILLEKSTYSPDLAFKDASLDTYRKSALAQLPNGSTAIQVAEEHLNPLPIFGWRDYEVVVDYDFYGQSFRRSVLYLDLNTKEQVAMTTLATKTDFAHTHDVALDLLRSWQVVPLH